MLPGRMCAFVKFLVTQFGSKGVSATMEESAGQAVHMHVYVHLGAKAEPCGRSTPPAAPRRSHVDACALCVVRCAQRWRLEIKKRSISLKTCITSWSLGPPPLFGFMHVAGLNRLKRCPNMPMRFRSGEARGVAFYKKKGKCKRELRPPPRKDTFVKKSK